MRLAYAWPTPGLRLPCAWLTIGLRLPCAWLTLGLTPALAYAWLAPGLRLDHAWAAARLGPTPPELVARPLAGPVHRLGPVRRLGPRPQSVAWAPSPPSTRVGHLSGFLWYGAGCVCVRCWLGAYEVESCTLGASGVRRRTLGVSAVCRLLCAVCCWVRQPCAVQACFESRLRALCAGPRADCVMV